MIGHSAQVAIIGAGPAGAHLAARLAAEGRSVLLFDPKGAWEKPCGGGVPARALIEFPFLLDNVRTPRKLVRHITLISPSNRRVSIKLPQPFAVYSRRVLNGVLLDRAIEGGAQFVRESVVEFTRTSQSWSIRTSSKDDSAATREWNAEFLVGADGAASFTRRRLAGIFPVRDLSIAFGYNVSVDESANEKSGEGVDEVVVRFPCGLTGYLWAFPRPGVINFGIAAKLGERTSDELRTLLLNFVAGYFGGRLPDSDRVNFFGAKIPTLSKESWPALNAAGNRWALVGDAAGFADPITGEGIYYALKSADLLAEAILDERAGGLPAENLYEERWRRTFGQELEHASLRRSQFFHGKFLGKVMTDAVVSLARVHKGVRNVLVQALMGNQSYVTLKYDLLKRVLQVF